MSGQLDQISEAIGEVRAAVAHLHGCVHRVEGKVDTTDRKVDQLSNDLNLDKSELAKLKAKGTGVLVGVALVSGFAGAKLAAISQVLTAVIGK